MSGCAYVSWRNRDVLDFRYLLQQVWSGRWWIIAAAAFVASLGWLVASFTTPLYEATAVLVPVSAQRVSLGYSIGSPQGAGTTLPAVGGAAALNRLGLETSRAATEEALAVLRSREFGYRFIKDLNLLPVLFADRWDDETGTWKVPAGEQPTESDAFERFDRDIRTLEYDRGAGLVTLRVTWRDRDVAATWANQLVERLNTEMRQRAISRADGLLRTLDTELENVTVTDTRDAVNDFIETQVNERMLASISEEFAFRIVDRALPPSKGDMVWPSTLLLIVAGWVVGSILGLMSVIVFHAVRPSTSQR